MLWRKAKIYERLFLKHYLPLSSFFNYNNVNYTSSNSVDLSLIISCLRRIRILGDYSYKPIFCHITILFIRLLHLYIIYKNKKREKKEKYISREQT